MTRYRVSRNGHPDTHIDATDLDIFGHLILSGPSNREGAGTHEKQPVAVYADGQWAAVVAVDAELFTNAQRLALVAAVLDELRNEILGLPEREAGNVTAVPLADVLAIVDAHLEALEQ